MRVGSEDVFTFFAVQLLFLDHRALVLRHRSAGVGVPVPAWLRRDVGHICIECRGWVGILIPTLVDSNLLQLPDALHNCLMELHEPAVKMTGQFIKDRGCDSLVVVELYFGQHPRVRDLPSSKRVSQLEPWLGAGKA